MPCQLTDPILGLCLYKVLPNEQQLVPANSLKGKHQKERNQVKCQGSLEKTGRKDQRRRPEGAVPEVRPREIKRILGERVKAF